MCGSELMTRMTKENTLLDKWRTDGNTKIKTGETHKP